MAIYLIRHAQSLGNVNGRTESHASIPLTDLGHLQAQKLTELLPKADRVFISAFIRTRLTAEPILQRDHLSAEILDIQEFSYLSDARCKNTTLEERKPWVDAYWQSAEVDLVTSDGAESFAAFYQRVEALIERLDGLKAEYQNQNLLVFSHGQFLQLFKMITEQKRELSSELMRDFRYAILNHQIGNAEFFIY
ncbi:histidine phosphatase family protein [Acinetobacter gerneri]|uniref:Histidine phosphatase family protein n=1 Tax=Acinetobacter gerneri TaxID=202952 RepID=A0AAW8JI18_9GAMM|nr:histidine phosphatase family protein [Acinetobacter gerneri]MDQ9008887.1 histidine phosphatase family protein [Acinetobacter gerneri]MDQ9012991.1 histidine phosphatase family protein [Acinetobacter gerneri]MDQ9024371.1 histidine phosphatase family protein [Acinetobacter gerneri]MDQ9051663.1 histidine phosphatase family protein [Acinetobacter gerneri]MDQ9059061.1 histidine phosphatase family protein [Acinetobacter gerneri]